MKGVIKSKSVKSFKSVINLNSWSDREGINLSRQFALKNGLVYVLTSLDENVDQLAKVSLKPITFVKIGSSAHLAALKERIQELTYMTLDSPDTIEIETEKDQRQLELDFFEQNIDDSSSIDSHESAGMVPPDYKDPVNDKMHLTVDMLERLRNFKYIRVAEAQTTRLFRLPAVRQFFERNVFHRENEQRTISWFELFADLVYLAALSKTIVLLTPSFNSISLLQLALVFVPVFYHWRLLTVYNNMFYHDDFLYKIFVSFILAGLVGMATSIVHAFDLDRLANSSFIFLISVVASKLAFMFIFVLDMIFIPSFQASIFAISFSHIIAPVMFYIAAIACVAIFSPSSQYTYLTWGLACLMEIFSPVLNQILRRYFLKLVKNLALNVEHFTARHGIWVTLVFGQFIIGIIFDHKGEWAIGVLFVICSFLIGINLFTIYYRIESTMHYRHAMYRVWIVGAVWGFLHVPLTFATLVLSSCLAQMTNIIEMSYDTTLQLGLPGKRTADISTDNLKVMFAMSVAAIQICLGLQSLMHIEKEDEPHISNGQRVLIRFLVAVLYILAPLANFDLKMSIIVLVLVTSAQVTIEEYGRVSKTKIL